MKALYKTPALVLLLLILILGSCEKDVPRDGPNVETPDEISRFIYEGLKDVYLWYDDVDKLGSGYFDDTDAYYEYLNGFGTDFESLFYDLLYEYGTVDKWSWIVDDYVALENSFAGISKSMGYDFGLVRISGSNDIFGYVRYVLPDSPAEGAGLQRGDLFTKVNGQQLTVDNYYDILLNPENYYLTKAVIINNTIYETETTPVMVAVVLQENPVLYYDVFDVGGVPTAYLVYNAFTSDFDIQLNEAFSNFISEGAQSLILDLRYNGGGSIQTAIYLASMIYSTETTKLFSKSVWNDKYNSYWIASEGADALNYYFANKIEATTETVETPISSMGLNKLYVITTEHTASASELVINGLFPYIDITVIGTNSAGKYVGSVTVKDWDSQGNVNPNHKWAMQPIVLKLANADNESDFINGLPVDVEADEGFIDLQPFGDENETLLKATIDHILGIKSAPVEPQLVKGIDYEVIADSKDFKPLSKEMYLEGNYLVKRR